MINTLRNVMVAAFLLTTTLIFAQNPLTIYAENRTVAPAEEFCVDIKVKNFVDVLNFEFTVRSEPDNFLFKGIENNQLSGLGVSLLPSLNTGKDRILVHWIAVTEEQSSIPDNSTLFSVCYQAVGINGTSDFIEIGEDDYFEPYARNLADKDISTTFINPRIFTQSTGEVIDFQIDEASLTSFACQETQESNYVHISGGSPPYNYEWTERHLDLSGLHDYHSTEEQILPEKEGTYLLKITDQNGYSVKANFSLSGFNGFPIETIKLEPSCQSPSSGIIHFPEFGSSPEDFDYAWSTGSTEPTIKHLEAGDYSLTITEPETGCQQIRDIQLDSKKSVVQNHYCYEENGEIIGRITLDNFCGFVFPVTILWSTGQEETISEDQAELIIHNPPTEGYQSYSARVTDTEGNQFRTPNVKFRDCAHDFGISKTITESDCNGSQSSASIKIFPPGDHYSILWNTGETTSEIYDLEYVSQGEEENYYSVTVTDQNSGNEKSIAFPFRNNNAPKISSEIVCTDHLPTTTIHTSIYPPFTFEWSNGDENTIADGAYSTSDLDIGSYALTVTNELGCESVKTIDVFCPKELKLEIQTPSPNSSVGDALCFDYIAKEFEDIGSIDFTIKWNPAILQFNTIDNFALQSISLANFDIQADEGLATFTWQATSSDENNITSGTSLFTSCFSAIQSGKGYVTINTYASTIQDSNNEEIPLRAKEVFYYVSSETEGNISIETKHGAAGENVCLEVRAKDISSLLGMQFSVNWDPAELQYSNIEITGESIAGVNLTSFGTLPHFTDAGILTFAWIEPTITYMDIPDDLLFKICFSVISTDGFRTVQITESPTAIEFIGENENLIFPSLTKGGIWSEESQLWPGDTDLNGIVNNHDLLNIGLGYGQTGPQRANATIDWTEQTAENWENKTPISLVNYKYADCNGDGVVNTTDRAAIDANWKKTTEFWTGAENNLTPPNTNTTTLSADALYVAPFDIEVGQTPTFDIILSGINQVQDAYGVSFTVVYDPDAIVPGSLDLTFAQSWLGIENSDMITFFHDDPIAGRLDMAITRIDGTPITSSGAIAQLSFQVANVVPANETYQMFFNVTDIRAITEREKPLLVVGLSTIATISGIVGTKQVSAPFQAAIFPNPVKKTLIIEVKGAAFEQIDLLNINGQLMLTSKSSKLDMSEIPSGIYFVKIYSDKGSIYRKVIKE